MKQWTVLAILVLAVAGCKNSAEAEAPKSIAAVTKSASRTVVEINSVEQFDQVIAQKNRLMVFDLYADWCGPCKMLAPVLADVAKSHGDRADIYKINTEKLPQLAQAFKVQGIPYVVYFKDGAIVNALTGVYPKEAYEQGIEILSEPLSDTADGVLREGVRRISIDGNRSAGTVHTYRGDKVELTIKPSGKPFTATIEGLDVRGESDGKSSAVLAFETKELGYLPLVITDSQGRKDRLWVGVIQYVSAQGSYRETDAKEFAEAMKEGDPLILDVRTPGEFRDGYIKGAKLIPVHELEKRLSELDSYKGKPVLIYCRSGNRSTVAAKILQENGFPTVINLRPGIIGWNKAGLPVEK